MEERRSDATGVSTADAARSREARIEQWHTPSPERDARLRAYWRANWTLITVLLVIWFLAAYAHPPFADRLNDIRILTGFPLGYWLAAQGSITIFVILIFVYAYVMNNIIDKKYGFEEHHEEEE